MKRLQRRQFLRLAASASALPVMSGVASAQEYPSRPVRLLVGFAPGGGTDVMARLLQPALSERLGQQIVIENRPGAGTNIATEAVLNAAPDGYTLLAASLANAGNATLYDNLNFNFLRDITAVAGIALDPFVLEVTPSLPVKTIPKHQLSLIRDRDIRHSTKSPIGATRKPTPVRFLGAFRRDRPPDSISR